MDQSALVTGDKRISIIHGAHEFTFLDTESDMCRAGLAAGVREVVVGVSAVK